MILEEHAHRLGPRLTVSRPHVVVNSHGEVAVPTRLSEDVATGALEAEDSAVERAIMRVAKHGADGALCKERINERIQKICVRAEGRFI